jgi:hypothetical protein
MLGAEGVSTEAAGCSSPSSAPAVVGAASPGENKSGRAAVSGGVGNPASSETGPIAEAVCGEWAWLGPEAAIDSLEGAASKKNPAPKDALIAAAMSPTSARYRNVPNGGPAAAAGIRSGAEVVGSADAICSSFAGTIDAAALAAGAGPIG